MAKFYGAVGYANQNEAARDVVVEEPYEKKYKGDLLRNTRRLTDGMDINDTVVVSNSISIISDAYAMSHFHCIRYVRWRDVCWEVTNVDASNYPRLILTLGGVYNGKTAN